MLDPFRVAGGDRLRDPNGEQKRVNEFMSRVGGGGELGALDGEKNTSVGLRVHEALTLQSADGSGDGDVTYAELCGQVDRARLAGFADQPVDHLHVVLGPLSTVIVARSLEGIGTHSVADVVAYTRMGTSFPHALLGRKLIRRLLIDDSYGGWRDTMERLHISIENAAVRFSELVSGLRGVTLRVNQGEFVFLTGPSGAGKSTLLRLLTKEVRPTSGRVVLSGREIGQLGAKHIPGVRRQMGIVPQDFALLPRKRVFENVAYAMRAVGHSRRETRRRVPEILERVHIAHRSDAYPHELSGGEQQRVAIGRALVNDPPLLVADEPTGNLDPEHSWGIMELLKELNRHGTTVLVASHDMLVVDRMEERVITLDHGLISSDRAAASSWQHSLPLEKAAALIEEPASEGSHV